MHFSKSNKHSKLTFKTKGQFKKKRLMEFSIKEGVHQFYKFVLKCKVRYTDTAVICDFSQICFYTARQLFRFLGTGSPGTQSWFSGTQSRFSGNTI